MRIVKFANGDHAILSFRPFPRYLDLTTTLRPFWLSKSSGYFKDCLGSLDTVRARFCRPSDHAIVAVSDAEGNFTEEK